MGFFSKFFGKSEQKTAQGAHVYYADSSENSIQHAIAQAHDTFKYFWRELYWERRRIVPALDYAMVKVPFSEEIDGDETTEHMWLNDVYFDGDTVYGTLINTPAQLQKIHEGDEFAIPVNEITDWLFACEGKAYGGFTVQAMRAQMDKAELQEHDAAWGLDFGDFNDIQVVYEQKTAPENWQEHPMSRNMREKFAEFLAQHPDEVHNQDAAGFTLLHHATIAGNLNEVEVLLAAGADKQAQTTKGETALTLAKKVGWTHIIQRLQD